MATKSSAKKKTTASRSGKTTTKVTTSKVASSKAVPAGLLSERNPNEHKVTGKYTFFYVLFACTTLIFAGVSTWLFIFSSELLAKYESIQTCARNHTTCEVRYFEEDTEEQTVEE